MVPSKRDEVRGAQAAATTSRKKSAAVNCRAGGAHYEKLGNSSADISRRNVEIGMEFQKVVYKFMFFVWI